jgi:hypothetical protein
MGLRLSREFSMSDMFEIESGKLALERGSAATKAFAQQMIEAHQKTTAAQGPSGQWKSQGTTRCAFHYTAFPNIV